MIDKTVAQRFFYPVVIDEVIDDFIITCHEIFPSDRLGILLVGSSARGELSWSEKNDQLCFYSDIEFIVVIDEMKKNSLDRFSRAIADLEKKRNLGDRFKIDFVINTWKALETAEKKIFVFDSKNTGIELGDVDVRSSLPDVTKETINFKELNDVLLHRMKALLTDVPSEIFQSTEGLDDFRLSMAKNALDITTWLHPYEADELVSGFQNRLTQWKERGKTLKLSGYFGDDEFNFLQDCIELRKGTIEDYEIVDMLQKYIAIYERAIAYCKVMNDIEEDKKLSDPQVSRSIFWEYNPRRRLKEATILIRMYRWFGLRLLLSNIFKPRKGKQVEFCYSMIKSLSFALSNEQDKFVRQVQHSELKLGSLRKIQNDKFSRWSQRWLSLRDQYIALNKVVI